MNGDKKIINVVSFHKWVYTSVLKMLENCFAVSTVIFFLPVSVYGISCYQCTPRPSNHGNTLLCSKFNGSALYQVDCPYSTFCMKRTFILHLPKQNVVAEIRDCAPQKADIQVPKNGAMRWESIILLGLYKNTCSWKDYRFNEKISDEEICYCDSHLCNGQAKKDSTAFTDLLGVIFVFNAMKYVRSFQ